MAPLAAALLATLLLAAPPTDPELRKEAARAFEARDWARASDAYRKLVAADPTDGGSWLRLASAEGQAGRLPEAAATYEKAFELGVARPVTGYNLACLKARMGQTDAAFEWLERVVALGFTAPEHLRADEDLVSLRSDPRWVGLLERAEQKAHPCRAARHRQFDFWIGEWTVADAAGNAVGTSSVQPILDGCVLLENWASRLGGAGKSFNVWDAGEGRWQQTWVDDKGRVTEYRGDFQEGSLHYEARSKDPDGAARLRRMTFSPLPSGQVRQLGQISNDGGASWTVTFDFVYTRRPEPR